eukprot:762879-Hanusia_phi.AAC.2
MRDRKTGPEVLQKNPCLGGIFDLINQDNFEPFPKQQVSDQSGTRQPTGKSSLCQLQSARGASPCGIAASRIGPPRNE